MGFNKIILQGNLTEEISLRYSNGGIAMASVSIAVSEKFKKQDGSQGESTLFVKLKFYARSAEIVNSYCRKGSKVLIEGKLLNNNWVDQQGNKRYDFEVKVDNLQMLDTKADGQRASHNEPQSEPSVTHEYVNDGMQPSYGVDQSDQEPAPDYGQVAEDKATKPYTPQQSILDYDVDEDEIPF